MSNTPRTDKNYIRGFEALYSRTLDEDEWVRAGFARRLETELAEARQQLVERDALVERMRESLIECLDDSNQVLAEYEQLYSATYRPQRLEAQKAVVSEAQAALSLTPSAALAEHDVEVRRKVLEEAAQDKGST